MNTYTYEEMEVGRKESFTVQVTEADMDAFRAVTGDGNPLHADDGFARDKGYEGKVAFGMLTASYLSTLAGVYLPGERSLIQSVETKFLKPVYPGDTLSVSGEITEKNEVTKIFRDVFDDDTLVIVDETNSGDIEDWDSLEHINLVVAMEKRFNMKFNLKEVGKLANVGEMVDLILSRM